MYTKPPSSRLRKSQPCPNLLLSCAKMRFPRQVALVVRKNFLLRWRNPVYTYSIIGLKYYWMMIQCRACCSWNSSGHCSFSASSSSFDRLKASLGSAIPSSDIGSKYQLFGSSMIQPAWVIAVSKMKGTLRFSHAFQYVLPSIFDTEMEQTISVSK